MPELSVVKCRNMNKNKMRKKLKIDGKPRLQAIGQTADEK